MLNYEDTKQKNFQSQWEIFTKSWRSLQSFRNMFKQELSFNTNTFQYIQALFYAPVAFLEKQAYIKNYIPIINNGTGKG